MMSCDYITNSPSSSYMMPSSCISSSSSDDVESTTIKMENVVSPDSSYRETQELEDAADDLNDLLRMPLPPPIFYEQYMTGHEENCNVWSAPFQQEQHHHAPSPVSSSSSPQGGNTHLPSLRPNPLVQKPPVSVTPLPPCKESSTSFGYKLQDLVVWLLDEQEDIIDDTTSTQEQEFQDSNIRCESLSPIEKEVIALGLPRAPTHCGVNGHPTTTLLPIEEQQPFQDFSNNTNVTNPLIQISSTTFTNKKKMQPKKKKSSLKKKKVSLMMKKKLAIADSQQPKLRVYQKENWWKRYGELEQYFYQNGHSQVSNNNQDSNNKELARWVKRQRYQYRHLQEGLPSSMTQERIVALERLNFVWDSHEAAWDIHMNELKAYKAKHGHCNVPSTCPKNKGLASWVKYQRRQYRLFQAGSEETYINIDRINQLEEMGFQWNRRKSL